MNKDKVTIVGLGKVGKALSIALKKAGFKIINSYSINEPINILGDIIFITTPDSQIQQIANKLLLANIDLNNRLIIHCSGTLPSEILEELTSKGAEVGCFHPLQSITKKTTSFKNIYFDIEGEEGVLPKLEELALKLGAKSIRVTKKEKELLHISAVIISNYLVTLADIALQISGSTEIPQRTLLDAFLPLMMSTLNNLGESTTSEALTGPIARGDIQTVQKHIKLLEKEENLLDLYKKLGIQTLELIGNDLKDNTKKFRLYDVLK